MVEKFNLNRISKEFTEAWSPVDVAKIGDFVLRAAKFYGEFHWHKHDNKDELFIVFKGKIKIQTRTGDVILNKGEGATVPRGVEHCPVAIEPSIVLMFEKSDVVSSGN